MAADFHTEPGSYQLELQINSGGTRSFHLYIPPGYDGAAEIPLVLVYHGATGSGRRVEKVSGFSETAERYGFIAAYPDGVDGYWNDGREVKTGNDDVAFTAALIDHLSANLRIRRTHVFAAGISNGAMMVFRLACELSGRLAAIAPVAGGTIPENVAIVCTPSEPVSVILFHGTEDTYLPYEGGELIGRVPGIVYSVKRSAETWAKLNGCGGEPRTTIFPMRDPTDGTQVRRDIWCDSRHGAAVALYTIYGGGHTWPSGRNSQLLNLGKTSREIKATEVIWQFFERHPKQEKTE